MGFLGANAKASSASARRRCGGFCLSVSIVSLFTGLVLFLIGIWGAQLYRRFTPVYRDITCKVQPPTIQGITDSGEKMHIQMESTTVCKNPNPYSVKIFSSKSSLIYIGEERVPVGNITRISAPKLEADGSGDVVADIRITPTGDMIEQFIESMMGSRQIPLYLQNNLMVNVDVKLLFGHMRVTRSVNKDCGMNLMMKGLQGVVGPMSCADDWDELVLADADSSGAAREGILDFSADGLGSEDLDKAEHLKTVSLGFMMGVGFGLGLLLLASGGLCLSHVCRSRRRGVAAKGAAAATDARAKGAPPPVTVPPPQEGEALECEV